MLAKRLNIYNEKNFCGAFLSRRFLHIYRNFILRAA
nr:MAG TPA: hypothetical protein [Caudoviricetes sp.]